MTAPLVIGIDVGGSKLAGVAVAGDDVRAERRQARSDAGLVEQVVALTHELEERAGGRAEAIGVAVPGQVDVATGVIELAVNLDVADLPIGPLVSDAFGVPCGVEHDARAVAAWLGGRQGAATDLAYLSVGTGISAGVVIGGRVVRGAAGIAGEIGHQLSDPAGPSCACGLVGCLEAIASGPAIARAAAAMASAADGDGVHLPSSPTAADVYRAAADGHPIAHAVVERAATHLAAAIRGLALAFGVSYVAVGGGVTRAGAAFAEPLRAALERDRAASALARRALASDAVEILDDHRPWGALGASGVARQALGPPASRPHGEVAVR